MCWQPLVTANQRETPGHAIHCELVLLYFCNWSIYQPIANKTEQKSYKYLVYWTFLATCHPSTSRCVQTKGKRNCRSSTKISMGRCKFVLFKLSYRYVRACFNFKYWWSLCEPTSQTYREERKRRGELTSNVPIKFFSNNPNPSPLTLSLGLYLYLPKYWLNMYLTHWNNSCSLLYLAHHIFQNLLDPNAECPDSKLLSLISLNDWYDIKESLTERMRLLKLTWRDQREYALLCWELLGLQKYSVHLQSCSGVREWCFF